MLKILYSVNFVNVDSHTVPIGRAKKKSYYYLQIIALFTLFALLLRLPVANRLLPTILHP